MKEKIFTLFKYLLSIGFSVLLFWYVYRNQDVSTILSMIKRVDFKWLLLSVFLSLISHFSRAWRWSIALKPLGYQVSIYRAFFAVMIGYFANIFVPRMGEIVRCGSLKKMTNTPVYSSFGTVLTERILDMIILIVIVLVVILVEFNRIGDFLLSQVTQNLPLIYDKLFLIAIIGFLFLFVLLILFLNRHRFRYLGIYSKIHNFLKGTLEGFLSIKRFDRSTQLHYLIHTIIIWLMYYLMGYVIFFSMEESKNLNLLVAGSVLAMSGLGMVVPTPGGTGSYHLFVSSTLMAYGLAENVGKSLALLMHSSQVIFILLAGGLSFILVVTTLKK